MRKKDLLWYIVLYYHKKFKKKYKQNLYIIYENKIIETLTLT